MSYSNQYFGKLVQALTFEDIVKFFADEQSESDKIEFKSYVVEFGSYKEKETKILEAICGLLNSDGGIVIWGAPKGVVDPLNAKRKIFLGALTPFSVDIEKDSFTRKIVDSITPSPRGIVFQQLSDGNGNFIYILEVERSPYSPHQYQNTYWMRIDGHTLPAPHHYIEALMKKVSFPKLEGSLVTSKPHVMKNYHYGDKLVMSFRVTHTVSNLSKMQNEHDVTCRLNIEGADFQGGPTYLSVSERTNVKIYLPAAATLYYGEPIERIETVMIIGVNYSETHLVEIALSFGGKSSPLMISKYSFEIAIDKSGVCDITNIASQLNKYYYEI